MKLNLLGDALNALVGAERDGLLADVAVINLRKINVIRDRNVAERGYGSPGHAERRRRGSSEGGQTREHGGQEAASFVSFMNENSRARFK